MKNNFKLLVCVFFVFILATFTRADDYDDEDEDHDNEDHDHDEDEDHDHDEDEDHDHDEDESHDHDEDEDHDHDHDHDDCGHHHHAENTDPTGTEVGHAFLVTMFAGLSTVVGAAAAFCVGAEKVDTEHSTFLAGCLSFAAAVMLYVSFVEIWHAAMHKFEEIEDEYVYAHIYTSLTFFGGIILGFVTSKLVELFEKRDVGSEEQAVEMQGKPKSETGGEGSSEVIVMSNTAAEKQKKELLRAGIVTAISIAIHNFPEGIVTFFSLIDEWELGVATAFAIAVHNIPEGISIAIPYYYASENRWKAFALAFVSGLAEPFGALIGYAILGDRWGESAFGVMFGFTAGIMVYISLSQLLPLARKNDPEDKVTTVMLFVGMFVMDLSLYVGGGHEH